MHQTIKDFQLKTIYLIAGLVVLITALPVFAYDNSLALSYLKHPLIQKECSDELQQLKEADQTEREGWEQFSEADWQALSDNDLIRRKRVGELLGEGCFQSPQDYLAASLIFQHGTMPDHYYQAFIWANRAVELGDEKAKHLVALTIDRYLVSRGRKQLFGSQVFAKEIGGCFCMQPVEETVTDALRQDYFCPTIQEQYQWLASLNEGKDCPSSECETALKPTPIGSIPGFW